MYSVKVENNLSMLDFRFYKEEKLCFVLYNTQSYINSESASLDSWCTGTLLNRIIRAQLEGMGDARSARYRGGDIMGWR